MEARSVLALVLAVAVVSLSGVSAATTLVARLRTASAMTTGAGKFLASLTPTEKKKATYSFDSKERFDWAYIPRLRRGIALSELKPPQRKLALALLETGLSTIGYDKAQKIMSLENVLGERERPAGLPFPRDPLGYYVTIFGAPAPNGAWGWRFEGHHISLNFTVVDGTVRDNSVSNTPMFLGADPAEVKDGPLKGMRALAAEEDKGRELFRSLDEKQRSVAVLDTKTPYDLVSSGRGPTLIETLFPLPLPRKIDPLKGSGLAAADMTPQQKALLTALIDVYLARMPNDIAAERATRLRGADFDKISFAWEGAADPSDARTGTMPTLAMGCTAEDSRQVCRPAGVLYYYRVQGPTFLVEYDNASGNHSHTVWRDFNGDFGEDLLLAHYTAEPHGAFASSSRLR
jgi:hypothetical protein